MSSGDAKIELISPSSKYHPSFTLTPTFTEPTRRKYDSSEERFYQKSVKPAALAMGLPGCAGFLLFRKRL
jgi:hypothetical protein